MIRFKKTYHVITINICYYIYTYTVDHSIQMKHIHRKNVLLVRASAVVRPYRIC